MKKSKKILAFVLTVAMMIGCISDVLLHVRAVDASTIESYTGYSGSVNLIDTQTTNTNASKIYLKGSTSLNDYKVVVEDWSVRLEALDEESGVFFNGTKVSNSKAFFKYNDWGNWWFAEGFTATEVGDTVTIKGTFIQTTQEVKIEIEESTFVWSGNAWVNYYGSVDVTGAQIESTNASKIYLKGNTSLNNYKVVVEDWTVRLEALDEASGVFFNGTKVSNSKAFFKYNDWGNWWFAEGFKATEVGDTVTIKGTFVQTTQGVKIEIEESTFEWNGTKWTKVVPVTYTEFSISSINSATKYSTTSGWLVYLNPSTTLPGTADSTRFNGLKVEIDGVESNVVVYKASYQETALVNIGTGVLASEPAEDTKVTLKAGKADSNDGSDGIELTEDFVMYYRDGSFTTEPPTQYTSFNISSIDLIQYNATSGWFVYLNPSITLPGTADSTRFNGLKVEIDGVESNVVVYKAAYHETALVNIGTGVLASEPTEDTKVTLKAGKAKSNDGSDGIELTEDFVMYYRDGSLTTEPPKPVTDITITGINYDTNSNSNPEKLDLYLKTDAELPGDNWGENFNFTVEVDGVAKTVTTQRAGAQKLFIRVPNTGATEYADTTITVKAGKYTSTSYAINLLSDITLYASKHGVSLNDKIWDANVTRGIHFSLCATQNYTKAFEVNTDADDPVEAKNDWSSKIYPVRKGATKETDTTVAYFNAENGVKVNNEWKDAGIALVKLFSKYYYVGLPDGGVTVASGDVITLGGVFCASDGTLVEFEDYSVVYKGDKNWEEYVAYTDVRGDITNDGVVDVCDLVRLLKYYKDSSAITVNENALDVNKDGVNDKKDIDTLRRILTGAISYSDNTSNDPSGIPTYSTKTTVVRMAYSCPSPGSWSEDSTTYTVNPDLDTELDAYKAAGFTMLNSEFVANLKDAALTEEGQIEVVTYLKAAAKHGLGVIVKSNVINSLLKKADMEESQRAYWDATIDDQGTTRWKAVLKQYVSFLKNYPAFRGFLLGDEISIQYVESYQEITEYLHQLDSELILYTAQYPVSAYDVNALGAAALTKDDATNNTKELAYKDYVQNFALANGHYTFDLYPLIYSEDKIFGVTIKSEYGVNSEWFDNLKWVADVKKDKNYAFTSGVTIQSTRLSGADTTWSKYERYAPTQKSDIGFQVYTAMAYGANEISYFTYMKHSTSAVASDSIAENEQVRAAVTSVNEEINAFGYVFDKFNWKDTLDIANDATITETGNSRLASADVTGGRTLVGCMKDADGFDGYMIANAEAPRTNNAVTVTLQFNNATKVIVYKGTAKETKEIADGNLEVTLDCGEGAFVIPIK